MSRFALDDRISQILPTVKCSDCGRDVQIRRLGDHLCSRSPPTPLPMLLPVRGSSTSTTPTPSPVTPPYNVSRSLLSVKEDSDYRHDTASIVPPPSPIAMNSHESFFPRKNSVSPAPSLIPPSTPKERSMFPTTNYEDVPRSAMNTGGGALDSLMADLLNTIQTTSGGKSHDSDCLCHVCGDEFDYKDDVIHIGRKGYHTSCYVCHVCHTPFGRREVPLEFEGRLYCQEDYDAAKHRTTCVTCHRLVAPSSAIKALDGLYHPGHLDCYQCKQSIHTQSDVRVHQNRVYCQRDFNRLLPLCRACNKPVEGKAVSAADGKLQGKWHIDCFGCQTCHRPFPDNTFYIFENTPYCKQHYHQANNSLCKSCNYPIEGPCAQTPEKWRFHPDCFRCITCRCAITDTYYMYEQHIYCETDIRQLQMQRHHVRAEKRHTQFKRI